MAFTPVDKDFTLKCLDDLWAWNTRTPSDDYIVEEDQLSEIFEEWPERIRNWEERYDRNQGKNK